MRFSPLLLFIIAGCAHTPNGDTRSWIKQFNLAGGIEEMQKAARYMEYNDYIRVKEQVAKNVIDKRIGSYPPHPLEKEMVYWRIARHYLFLRELCSEIPNDYRCKGNVIEKANVSMRKLMLVENPHRFSLFLVARNQELNGKDYNEEIVRVPTGMKYWHFSFGTKHVGYRQYVLNDVSEEYQKIIDVKKPFELVQKICGVMMLCLGIVQMDDDVVLNGLEGYVLLTVINKKKEMIELEL